MIEIRIEGMTCGGCVTSVKKAVSSADETASTEIDLTSGIARIETALPRNRIVEAIEAAGYDVVAG